MILITFRRAHSYLEFIVLSLKMVVISETCKNPSKKGKVFPLQAQCGPEGG
jgi:hypothetical protein